MVNAASTDWCGTGERYRNPTPISMLPDDVLLEIFDFCQENDDDSHGWLVWEWHLLVHVCQRWRQIIFASPHRLNLRIFCTPGTPVRENLGIWPPLPIVIKYQHSDPEYTIAPDDEDNVIAALEHPDLIRYLGLDVTDSQLGNFATAMQEPYPVLTYLDITSLGRNALVLPTDFLGGSAPCLRTIDLRGIPFPALPTLLLSASDLVFLFLHDIPPTGYVSPEAMGACLSALPRLESFVIEFQLATPRPDRMRLPPATRAVLPALKIFVFQGASEYLEDLVVQIDSPQLDTVRIYCLNQLVDFQVTRLSKFIDRSLGLKLTPFQHAVVYFCNSLVSFGVHHHANHPAQHRCPAETAINCKGIDWQVSHMAQVLSQLSPTLSIVNHLTLHAEPEDPPLEGTDDVEWPHLLHQFSAVTTLHVSHKLARHVALALENITGGIFAEALPSLDCIYLEGQPASSIEKFVAIRQLSSRPVTVIDTEEEFEDTLLSYIKEQEEDDDDE